MRGSLSILTKEPNVQRYRTGIFLATAEPELVKKILLVLKEEFPKISFTPVGPRAYAEVFRGLGNPVWLEDLKLKPWHGVRRLRRQRFDIAAVVLPGRPTFFKPKLLTLLLNPARFVIFNENADSFVLDRKHWNTAGAQFVRRSRLLHPGPLLFIPFGFTYLLVRTLRLALSGRVRLAGTVSMSADRN